MRRLKNLSENGRADAPREPPGTVAFVPPRATFDPRLGDELARLNFVPPEMPEPPRPDAYNHYERALTDNGGVRIVYHDIMRHWLLSTARLVVWTVGTIAVARFFVHTGLGFLACWTLIAIFGAGLAGLLGFDIYQVHCIEVHPDGLIVDGRFFSIEDIGENWPILHFKRDNDPSRYVLRGIVGTRLIDFATVNRIDTNDRTAERLSQDLDLAMEQLWGRREAIYATAF